jgi:hypothetical protein
VARPESSKGVGDQQGLPARPSKTQGVPPSREDVSLFYSRGFGPLDTDGKKSPLVNVFLPVRKRGVRPICSAQRTCARSNSGISLLL